MLKVDVNAELQQITTTMANIFVFSNYAAVDF